MNTHCIGKSPINPVALLALLAVVVPALPVDSPAQTIQSTVLADKIHSGSGVIDLLKSIGSSDLNSYFAQTGKLLLLGVDVNEDNSGNESSHSLGVAIKDAQLAITTTDGNFTFKDFFTSTSAMLKQTGSATAADYYTMFGQGGSSQITGTGSLNISKFDDVMWFENINFTGDITSAKLAVNFLDTGKDNNKSTSAETFFDFSGGFEDFALFNVADAVLLERANIGIANAPAGVTYATTGTTAVEATAEATAAPAGNGGATGTATDAGTGIATGTGSGTGTGGDTGGIGALPNTPAAPAPPLLVVLFAGALSLWRQRMQAAPLQS